jgi:hypothetical protein
MPKFVQGVTLAAPTTHFVQLAQAILYRGRENRSGLETVPDPARHRLDPILTRAGAVPQDDQPDGVILTRSKFLQ